MKIETGDFIVRFDDSQVVKDEVFDALIKWYMEMEAFSGESIMQADEPQLTAAEKLSDIADDIIKFDVQYKGD